MATKTRITRNTRMERNRPDEGATYIYILSGLPDPSDGHEGGECPTRQGGMI